MGTATRISTGSHIDYTPGTAKTAGAVVVQGDLVGVCEQDIAANALGALAVEGVFDFTKAASDGGITVGSDVYWDEAEAVAKTNAESGANLWIGKAVATAATSAVLVRVLMGQTPDTAAAHSGT